MNLRIICTRPDGGVSVICPAPKARREGENDVQFAARIAAKDGSGKGLFVRDTKHKDQLIGSRYFRDIWEWSDTEGKAVVSLTKARAQRIEEIRNKRNALLDITDKEKNRMDDLPDMPLEDRRALAAKRNALRDIPNEAEAALDTLTLLDDVMKYEPSTWPEATDSRRAAFVEGQPFGTNVGAEAL